MKMQQEECLAGKHKNLVGKCLKKFMVSILQPSLHVLAMSFETENVKKQTLKVYFLINNSMHQYVYESHKYSSIAQPK
jgi:hypothetical protein